MLQVDIRARNILSSQRVWRLFPGSSYKFLPHFLGNDIGYLDFPGLILPEGPLAASEDLIPRIVLSHAVRANRPPTEDDQEDLSLEQFLDARRTANRSRLRSALINLYAEAKAGDLVVLPTPLSERNVWIGEITSNETDYVAYYRASIEANVPARHIKWVQAVKENSLSSALSESLRNQFPFALIERSQYREVFALAYSSFSDGEMYCSTISNDDEFLDVDSAFLGIISKLAAAACWAIDNDVEGLGGDAMDAVFRGYQAQYTCLQESNIHSPGFTRYLGATVVALSIAVLTTSYIELSHSKDAEELRSSIQAITVVNSVPNSDPLCTIKVSEVTKRVLSSIDIDTTIKMCEAAKSASDRTKLQSSAKARRNH